MGSTEKTPEQSPDCKQGFLQWLGQLPGIKPIVLATACLTGGILGCTSDNDNTDRSTVRDVENKETVPIKLENEALLDRGIIRIGIRSNVEEKKRIRGVIKNALRIVLADPELAKTYAQSKTVEHLVVPDIAKALKKIAALHPEQLQHLDVSKEVSLAAHGDAYTIAIETLNADGKLLEVENYMLLKASLVQQKNYPQLVVTLDHECRHMMFRGKHLSRRDEEVQVYTSGINRMERVANVLKKQGGEDEELGKRILTEALPMHRERLHTWKQFKK